MNEFFPVAAAREGRVEELGLDRIASFCRRVVGIWALSLFLGMACMWLTRQRLYPLWTASGSAALLLALSVSRRLWQGGWADTAASWLITPFLAWMLSETFSFFVGFPSWAFPLAALSACAYLMMCGRNVSFAGMAAMGSLLSAGAVALGVWRGAVPLDQALPGWAAAALTLCYLSYDMAMILRRRRADEAVPAAADLWRDLLNWLTYPFLILRHWARYRFDPDPRRGAR